MLETILTLFMMLGIVALVVLLFFKAIRRIFKILANSIGGLVLLFLIASYGGTFGIDLGINAVTVIVTLLTGVFGVAAMLIYHLLF